MRVLLDEQLPVDLAEAIQGHSVDTVVGRGWAGITNGELLQRMRGEYDALITMDQGIEFQQNLSGLDLTRFRGHCRSHESAVGVSHGQAQAASVHERVQG